MSKWVPDPNVVQELRDRAKRGASLEELQALCGCGGIPEAAYFIRAFRVPLPEMKALHAWAGLDHNEAVEQRRRLLALVRQAVAESAEEEV